MKKKTSLFMIIAVFLSLSCGNLSDKKMLNRLYNSTINIPYNLIYTINGKINKEKYFNGSGSRIKCIAYFDSQSCSSCAVNKLTDWKNYIEMANEKQGEFVIYFIATPKGEIDFHNIQLSLMSNPIDYPVLIDKNGDFEKMNPHLPKNKAMHTFLLDENNKVILVGNPLHNKEIEKLFYKKTQELLSK